VRSSHRWASDSRQSAKETVAVDIVAVGCRKGKKYRPRSALRRARVWQITVVVMIPDAVLAPHGVPPPRLGFTQLSSAAAAALVCMCGRTGASRDVLSIDTRHRARALRNQPRSSAAEIRTHPNLLYPLKQTFTYKSAIPRGTCRYIEKQSREI
jgi:hypothetical protein